MRFSIYPPYNLDLMDLMNVLTGEEFYVDQHKDSFTQFGEPLSQDSERHIKQDDCVVFNSTLSSSILSRSILLDDILPDSILSNSTPKISLDLETIIW